MDSAIRAGKFCIILGALFALACDAAARDDGSLTAAERVQLAEKLRLVEQRHMPCQAVVVAAVLDVYLATELRPVSAELVPIRNDADLHWAWVIRVDGRTTAVLTAELPAPSAPATRPATRPADGPAAKALLLARQFIGEHFERSRENRAREKNEPPIPPIPPERLTGEYQEKTHGIQIVAIELADPKQMLWKVTAKPVGKWTSGGEIWMRFTPDTRFSAEFGQ